MVTTIISICLGVISFILGILLIIFDKSMSKTDKIQKIKALLPDIIVKVEEYFGGGNGKLKKEYALVMTQKACIENKLSISKKLLDELDTEIENILKTPQKKNHENVC